MSANVLKMNVAKTEMTLFGSQQMFKRVTTKSIHVAGEEVKACPMMKHLGVWLDNTLTLKHRIM